VTQQKFISQLIIQDDTWIHHFDSESEQQSIQWNERIGQNCHFTTLRNFCLSMYFDLNFGLRLLLSESLSPSLDLAIRSAKSLYFLT